MHSQVRNRAQIHSMYAKQRERIKHDPKDFIRESSGPTTITNITHHVVAINKI